MFWAQSKNYRTAATRSSCVALVFALPERDLRALRRERLGYAGQNPGSGLNPRMRVRSLLRELADDRTPAVSSAPPPSLPW
jgi:ABC-type glutathione transport system ATPase component